MARGTRNTGTLLNLRLHLSCGVSAPGASARGVFQALSGYRDRIIESSHPTFKDSRRAGTPVEASLSSSFCSAWRVPDLKLKIKTIKKNEPVCKSQDKQPHEAFLGRLSCRVGGHVVLSLTA